MNNNYHHLEEKLRKERNKRRKVAKASGTLSGQVERMKMSKGYIKTKKK